MNEKLFYLRKTFTPFPFRLEDIGAHVSSIIFWSDELNIFEFKIFSIFFFAKFNGIRMRGITARRASLVHGTIETVQNTSLKLQFKLNLPTRQILEFAHSNIFLNIC